MVPHLSTRHAHGCLASEIGRDPAFPTRYDRTESSSRVTSPDMCVCGHSALEQRESLFVCVWVCSGHTHTLFYIECVCSVGSGRVVSRGVLSTHRSYNQGLISADRSNKATLLLTIPRCLLSRLQRISRAQLVKLLCNDRDPPLRREPSHNHMVQAEAIDTRVIGQPFSFLAWILF